jgi:hypothetical protein
MKNLFNNIPESEKQRILEMHKGKNILSEEKVGPVDDIIACITENNIKLDDFPNCKLLINEPSVWKKMAHVPGCWTDLEKNKDVYTKIWDCFQKKQGGSKPPFIPKF